VVQQLWGMLVLQLTMTFRLALMIILPMLVLQIQTNLATKTCPTKAMISNNPPVINAGADYTIPKGTAFV
jgi:hypothetical protein